MKIGMFIPYNQGRFELPVEKVLKAERLGLDSVWTSEAYGSDAFTPLAYLAALTKRIRLGTSIAQLAGRTPANLAMTAQTLEALAGEGRVVVGLGVSGPQVVEGWHGQPWGRPNDRLRDYVAIVKKIWARDAPVTHDGVAYSLPYSGPDGVGAGKPLKSILHGNPELPVLLGTSRPESLRITGEVADGWISMYASPESASALTKHIREGVARRTDGKRFEDLEIIAQARVRLTDDVRGALDEARPGLAMAVGGMGSKSINFHKQAMIDRGYREHADRIQELFLAGRKAEAIAAVPDEYIDEAALIGTAERIRARLVAWRDAGFTSLVLGLPDDDAMELVAAYARGL